MSPPSAFHALGILALAVVLLPSAAALSLPVVSVPDDPTPAEEEAPPSVGWEPGDQAANADAGDAPGFAIGPGDRHEAYDPGTPVGLALAGSAALVAGGLLVPHTGLPWDSPIVRLYSRFRKNTVLGHGMRARLYASIQTKPGVTFGRLQGEFAIPTGVLYHHLRMLERHEMVRSRREGNRRVYWQAGLRMPGPDELLSPAQVRLLHALRAEPGISREQLAARLGVTPQAVGQHARRLEERGLLELRRHGGRLHYAPRLGASPGHVAGTPMPSAIPA